MAHAIHAGNRGIVISRLLAAFIPGFLLTNSLGILVVLALPFDRMQVIPWVMVLAFLFYSLLIMWVFHVPSAKRAWTMLLAGLAVTSAAIAGILFLGGGA